jgi:CheY-like chemotaxis protein
MIQGLKDRKAHILLLEDNPGDVDLLRRALRSAEFDCELTVLEDGAEALAFVRQQGKYASASTPDLVVLDLNLPKNDGLEVLEAMRASQVFDAVPVAILSSSSSPHEQAKMEAFRIGRFITKPPDLEEFLKIGFTLKSLLEESRRQDEPSRA